MKTRLLTSFLLLFILTGICQENLEYQKPPKEILELADFEMAPRVLMDDAKEYMVLAYRNTYKTLDELSQEEMRLGGLRINPVTNISSTVTYVNNLKVQKVRSFESVQVNGLPQNPKLANMVWAPNQKMIAFTHTTNTGVELWVLDVASAKATRLTEARVNANMWSPVKWFSDNKNILVRMLPSDKKTLVDPKKDLPSGPIISTADGSVSQNRTYQDLLKNQTDEANFEALVTSELHKISIDGAAQPFMAAAMYTSESFSPDGNFVLVTTLEKPFSYVVPYSRFPQKTMVYTSGGKPVKLVNETPLREVIAKGFMATFPGKRSMNWRDDKPATLTFVEALDGGDPANKVDFRDELFEWEAPFEQNPKPLAKTINRFAGVTWGNASTAILYDQWYDTRNVKTYLFNPSNAQQAPKIIFDRNQQDIYSDPGNFETRRNEFAREVLAIENGHAYLIGEGYTKEGQFPFIDEFDLSTSTTERLYQSNYKDKKEEIYSIEDFKAGVALVQLQSKNEFPNFYLRNLKKRMAPIPITNFKNPFESLQNVHKEVIQYTRKDGVQLSGTLYLPVGYDKTKKEKLPLLIWAYPEEFKDKNSAGQSAKNPNEFTFPYYGSFVYWVTRGYVVLDDASFPIVGEGETEPNDTFVEQLVANAEAAIDAVDQLGYIDRSRVAVGGHSYGAFMTANLLTHSKLFACGIARSGAYNRTLTPFGFQTEQRNYWDKPEIYNTMSPFMNAHKMKTPILLVHGEADNNPGTFTLQTERYFQALKGLGAPARMVILPKESHGYAAKENILHLLWEQDRFLEQHLKGKTESTESGK